MYELHKHLLSSGHTSLPVSRILRCSIVFPERLVRPNDSCARHPFEILKSTLKLPLRSHPILYAQVTGVNTVGSDVRFDLPWRSIGDA